MEPENQHVEKQDHLPDFYSMFNVPIYEAGTSNKALEAE